MSHLWYPTTTTTTYTVSPSTNRSFFSVIILSRIWKIKSCNLAGCPPSVWAGREIVCLRTLSKSSSIPPLIKSKWAMLNAAKIKFMSYLNSTLMFKLAMVCVGYVSWSRERGRERATVTFWTQANLLSMLPHYRDETFIVTVAVGRFIEAVSWQWLGSYFNDPGYEGCL